MSDRKSIQLGDYANVLSGFPFPSEGFSQEEGVPLIRIRDLLASELETYFIGPYPDNFVIDDGDILIGMDGDFNIVRWTKGKALLNQRVCKVFTSAAELDNGYLFWLLEPKLQDIHQKTPQTTVKHLSVRDLVQLRLEIPPVNEQRLIARILDTLDTQIEKTEALIAKLVKVKEGLLHDLLTRGIDENGQLRPSPQQAPELYKESPLGLIPREWDYKPFGGLCVSSAFGPRFPSDAYDDEGPLATLRTTDMDEEGNISLSTMPRAAIEPSVFADHLLREGDIVISRSGTCGVTGIFTRHDTPVIPGAFLIRFRLHDIRLNRFYRRYFNSSIGSPLLSRLAVGGVQKNIKGSDVLCLNIPTPSPEEAIKIADRIDFAEHSISSNLQLCSALKSQKSGLMDDLLTGRIRVTPLLGKQIEATSA